MDDPRAAPQQGISNEALARRLLIVVPPHLPSRVGYFTGMLAGSGIDIIVDRRHAVRRRSPGALTNDRRRGDRRGHHHLFGYLYGCSIVQVGHPTPS